MARNVFVFAGAALALSLAAPPAFADAPPEARGKGVVRSIERSVAVRRVVRQVRRHHVRRARAWDGRYGYYPRRHYFVEGLPTANPFGSSVGVLYGGWTYYTPGPAVAWYPYSYRDSVVRVYPRPAYRPFCDCY
jgi:hypothetical protein